jgi:hypothetical protein
MRRTIAVVVATMALMSLALYSRLDAQPSSASLQKRVDELEKQVAALQKTAHLRATFEANPNRGAQGQDGTHTTWLPLTVAQGGKKETTANCVAGRFMAGVKINPALGLQIVCAQGAWTGDGPNARVPATN